MGGPMRRRHHGQQTLAPGIAERDNRAMATPDELSPSQAAKRLGTSTRSVQRWIAAGRLPARRVGGRWRVASDAFDAFTGGSSAGEAGSRAPTRTMFIANRGEIAARIRRTCDRLGIRTVVPGEDGRPSIDLLDARALVAAARAAGADAVHPGFGFLSENADFAEQVIAAGIRWVGPPPVAIRAMGDKAGARRLAVGLGIPVVPGYDGPDQSDDALAAAAAAIGTPLIVKPSGGGGGKGMRIVRELDRLPDAIAAARREALAAFGDDRLILERYLDGPRHVEVQVLCDAQGTGVHLGERDCSVQRRHQKVLEETPSPAVDDALRGRLGSAALALSGSVGYVSAGTCEFLLDDRGRFFFLEMNTRLQVEHPVTEMVTGRDLVADQLRIAAGEPLGFDQAEVDAARVRGGHAVEVRLYAEDAEAGFLPAGGRIELLRWPADPGGRIRVDAGIVAGAEVGDRFDPMLAKIVAGGTDRAAALARLTRALDATVVLGLTTNLRFLRWLVRQPVVLDGAARIDTLERIWPPDRWAETTEPPAEAWATAARLLAAAPATAPSSTAPESDPWGGGWRLNAPARIRLVADGDRERVVDLSEADDEAARPSAVRAADGTAHVDVAGRGVAFRVAPAPDVDRAVRAAAHHGGSVGEVAAPMPGAVLAVHVRVGDEVDAGDPLITLEAMKMEHVVVAPGAGTVVGVGVLPADQVRRGHVLAVLG
jgi:excisionase family DNA binding protein